MIKVLKRSAAKIYNNTLIIVKLSFFNDKVVENLYIAYNE
jgi:hypothetical protein